MKKICIVAFSLFVAAALALGTISPIAANVAKDISLCDLEYEYVSF